jgi:hypothetical protein
MRNSEGANYCRRDGWLCAPGDRCDEHAALDPPRLEQVWAPHDDTEWDAWTRGYFDGWRQGYRDGCAQ